MTRSRSRALIPECTRRFKETIENPCILQAIVGHLDTVDMIHLKQVSKDSRFVDVIDNELDKILAYKKKTEYTISVVKTYLEEVEKARGSENKVTIIVELFDFLCNNKWFLADNEPFRNVVHTKLFSLANEYPNFQEHAIKYLHKLFDLKIPERFYNSKLGISQFGMFDVHNNFVVLDKHT